MSKKRLAGPGLDCYKVGQVAEADQIEPDMERFFGPLPELRGSPNQITWARSLRVKSLVEVRDLETSITARISLMTDGRDYGQELFAYVQEAGLALASIDDARWWIDHRGCALRFLLLEIIANAFKRHIVDVLFQDT